MTRWLLRFGYDGEGYLGWARQPGRVTVEGTIRDGLARTSLAGSVDLDTLEVASRTDAGVSARSNALALASSLPALPLLRGLNGLAPTIFFTAAREIPPTFRVRSASWREYRYYLPGDRRRALRLRALAERFPHELDVRTFGRGFPADLPAVRALGSLTVRFDGRGVRIDVRATGFVWGMVRRIVAALLLCEEGTLTLEEVRAAADGHRRLTLPLAPPDGLVLWEVHYPGRWAVTYARRTRDQVAHLAEVRRKAEVRRRVVRAL